MTRQEVLDRLASKVASHGWALTYVEGGAGRLSWCYSVGMIEHWDHPELVVVGLEQEAANFLLNSLARQVQAGQRLRPGMSCDASGVRAKAYPVHPAHVRHGAFDMWQANYRWLPDPPAFRGLEVVAPELLCRDHRAHYPMLTAPQPVVGNPLLGRTARRAEHRSRHRRS